MWRWAAAQDALADAWRHLAPHTREPAFAATSGRLHDTSLTAARRIHWPAVAAPDTLDRHGIMDAAPGMASILDAYLTTLPCVLVLVAGTRPDDHT